MKKIFILIGVCLLVFAGWFAFSNLSNDYEVMVVDQVSELEEELAVLETSLLSGTLTPDEAVEAQASITTKLTQITAGMNGATSAKLTSAQKAQLQAGLRRLLQVLLTYQDTLVEVDTTAARSPKIGVPSGMKTLVSQFADVIDVVEGTVDESVEGYAEDLTATAVIDQINENTPDTIEELLEQVAEETATSSKEIADDTNASSTDEMVEEEVIEEDSVEENNATTESEPEASVEEEVIE